MLAKLIGLLRHSLIYSFSTLATQIVGVLLVPVFTRLFSREEYGVIDLIATVIALLTLLLILGLDSGVGRYYADSDSNEDRRTSASTTIFFLGALSFTAILVLLPFSKQLSDVLFGSREYGDILLVALATVPLVVLKSSFQNLLRWNLQPVRVAVVAVGTMLLQISLTIYLVMFTTSGLVGIYVASLIAHFVFSIVGFWLARSSYAMVFSRKRLRQMLSFGLPYVVLSLSYYVLTYADRYMLRYYTGLGDVGLYAVGYRLSYAIYLILAGFQYAWGPFFLSTYRDADARQTFAKVFDYTSIAATLFIMLLSLFSKELLLLFATDDYIEAYRVIPLISASAAIYCLGGYFAIGIGISKKTVHVAWTATLAALANIGLNIALIPPFGIVGAAIATIISFAILAIPLMIVSQSLYKVPYRFSSNFLMYLAAASMIALAYLFLLDHVTWLNFMLKMLILIAFLAVPFCLKLISNPEITYVRSLAGNTLASLRRHIRPR